MSCQRSELAIFPLGTRMLKGVIVVNLSLLLSGTVALAAERSATVTLNSVSSSPDSSGIDALGTVTVVTSTGPAGSTTVSVTLNSTAADHTYALYVVRGRDTFRILDFVTWIDGTGGALTLDGVEMARAPTNNTRFLLADLKTGEVVAVSDPIKY